MTSEHKLDAVLFVVLFGGMALVGAIFAIKALNTSDVPRHDDCAHEAAP